LECSRVIHCANNGHRGIGGAAGAKESPWAAIAGGSTYKRIEEKDDAREQNSTGNRTAHC